MSISYLDSKLVTHLLKTKTVHQIEAMYIPDLIAAAIEMGEQTGYKQGVMDAEKVAPQCKIIGRFDGKDYSNQYTIETSTISKTLINETV